MAQLLRQHGISSWGWTVLDGDIAFWVPKKQARWATHVLTQRGSPNLSEEAAASHPPIGRHARVMSYRPSCLARSLRSLVKQRHRQDIVHPVDEDKIQVAAHARRQLDQVLLVLLRDEHGFQASSVGGHDLLP
jgi:hypothetical protein